MEPIGQLISQILGVFEGAGLSWPAARCEAAVILTNDMAVRTLNRDFRNIDKTTNVLSFPVPTTVPNVADVQHIGDVILASETILREAAYRRLDPRHHLTHLIVHGILHLLGYDHENNSDADKMEQLEIRILSDLGICNPYRT